MFDRKMTEAPDTDVIIKQQHRAATVLAGRKIITTQNGFLGCAPLATQQGDRIYRLEGCGMPVILRPQGECLEVVGECFMDSYATRKYKEKIKSGLLEREPIILC